jgi:hypothetical protein
MDDIGKMRLAFIAGFQVRDRLDMVQHMENLKAVCGIDLEAELMCEGFDQFTTSLPELIKQVEES